MQILYINGSLQISVISQLLIVISYLIFYFRHIIMYSRISLVLTLLASYFTLCLSSEIIQLTNTTLYETTNENQYVLVYFYSNTCKQCFATAVQFDKLSKEIQGLDVILGKISGDANPALVKQLDIKKYPAIVFFDQRATIPYKASVLSSTQMKNWLTSYLSNRVITINQNYLKQKVPPYLVVKGQSQSQRKIINKAVYQIEGIDVYKIKGQYKEFVLSLYKQNNQVLQYKYQLNRVDLKNWIQTHTKTIVQPLNSNQQNQKVFFNKKLPALVAVFAGNDRKNHQIYNIIVDVCESYKDKFVCGQIIPKYETFQGSHGYFQVKNTNKSFIGFIKQQMRIAYHLTTPFKSLTKKILQKFVNDALEDKIQRVVDNTAPTSAKFQQVQILTPENLLKTLQQNKFVFLNFYKSDDDVSLVFSRPYQALAKSVKSQKQIKHFVVAAFDCTKYQQFCEKQKFSYYPYLRLYINGVKIQYPKTQKLPQIPTLTRFLYQKKNQNITKIDHQDQLKQIQKPLVLIKSSKILPQFEALPALWNSNKIYFIQSKQEQQSIQIYHSQEILKYDGDNQVNSISNWILAQTQFLLVDIMNQQPDSKVHEAMKNKKPILLLLQIENDKESKKLRTKLGLICKKLKVAGTFAQESHRQFVQVLQWIGLSQIQESKLVYLNLSADKKYLYRLSVYDISVDSVKQFMKDVKAGKVKAQTKVQNQDIQQKVEKPIVEQL